MCDNWGYGAVGALRAAYDPWNAVTITEHEGLRVRVTNSLDHVTVVEQDPLGRIERITDAADGITRYACGPFGLLHTVIDPGRAVTRITRDAFGRVRQLDDPDRSTMISMHDGFGELIASAITPKRETPYFGDLYERFTEAASGARANAAAGLKETPAGYTWHHRQDKGLMQLIETDVYEFTGHTGGFR